jgi:hypothetical protein
MVNSERVKGLIEEHFARRPLMRVTDVYKLLYQGVFGVGHFMGEAARERLQEEAGRIDPEDHLWEPLIERVSSDGSMVRVNLRTFLRRRLPLDRLFKIMKETAALESMAEDFLSGWRAFNELVEAGIIAVDKGELERLNRELDEDGIRPRHHSEAYRDAYYPAYRVVRWDKAKDAIPDIELKK